MSFQGSILPMRIEEFQDFLDRDLAWRKLEISQLFMILNTVESKEIIGKSICTG